MTNAYHWSARGLNPDLTPALFDVALCPLHARVELPAAGGQPTLFPLAQDLPCGDYRAVVDLSRREILATVSANYELITNAEAIELGREAFDTLFGRGRGAMMKPFNLRLSSRRTICEMDFVHEDGGFEGLPNDAWVPFMRITNSYNRTRRLGFDIGFCRLVCSNGLILGRHSVSFDVVHSGGAREAARFRGGRLRTSELIEEFRNHLRRLREIPLDSRYTLPLALKAFNLVPNRESRDEPYHRRLILLRSEIDNLTQRYVDELGQNAYTVLNVLTDFAASGIGVMYVSSTLVDGYQRAASRWADDFLDALRQSDFQVEAYLGQHLDDARWLRTLVRTA
jgi:hypothetical protein